MGDPKTREPDSPREPDIDEIPLATVQARKRFSIVWLIPLVAAIAGGWLAYQAITQKGPKITITFESAGGLEAGKTQIKYKEVELGKVEWIGLSDDLSHVVVRADMVKEAGKYLTETTRFWIVRARVAAGEVSGLGTLLSGAYIGMDPGQGGANAFHFTGLNKPPQVTTDVKGRRFKLKADRLGSVDVGSPVYYRQIKVGRVVDYRFETYGNAVLIDIFIETPHDRFVRRNTRFWNAGGFSAAIDSAGIRIDAESFVTLIIGGVAFETPTNLEPSQAAPEDYVFDLFDSRKSIYERTYARKELYLLHFTDSVRGLNIDAPVEFRGIKIGRVVDLKLEYDQESLDFRIPVLVEIEPERMVVFGQDESVDDTALEKLVAKGLRAQLKIGSLITGQLVVEFGIHPDASPAKVVQTGRYTELPTIPAPLERITANLAQILEKLQNLPIEQIGDELLATVKGSNQLISSVRLDDTMASLDSTINEARQFVQDLNKRVSPLDDTINEARQFVENLNKGMGPQLQEAATQLSQALGQLNQFGRQANARITPQAERTLIMLQQTLSDIQANIGADSVLSHELRGVFKDISETLQSIRAWADYLERHPEALIYGKGKQR